MVALSHSTPLSATLVLALSYHSYSHSLCIRLSPTSAFVCLSKYPLPLQSPSTSARLHLGSPPPSTSARLHLGSPPPSTSARLHLGSPPPSTSARLRPTPAPRPRLCLLLCPTPTSARFWPTPVLPRTAAIKPLSVTSWIWSGVWFHPCLASLTIRLVCGVTKNWLIEEKVNFDFSSSLMPVQSMSKWSKCRAEPLGKINQGS